MDVLYSITMLWLGFKAAAASTVILESPTNTSILSGNSAVLKCSIQSQTDGQAIFWRRMNSTGIVDKILTYNNNSLQQDLYEVIGYYNLLIKSPSVESEGLYQCDTGTEKFIAALTVLVPMQNLTVTWGPVIPFTLDTWTNITCISSRSRPAADLRWFYGTHDITSRATSYYKQTGADGYGDSISTIEVQVTSSQIPYRCVADLPGHSRVGTEFLFPPITDNALMAVGCFRLMSFGLFVVISTSRHITRGDIVKA